MPIYTYKCPEHGRYDVFTRHFDALKERPCEKCGGASKICVTAPSRHNIERTWNDKANEYRQNPYTQAKAQLTNMHRSHLEHIERDCDRDENPVQEEAIQIAAKEIDKQNRAGPQMGIEEKHARRQFKAARKTKSKEV
ncbi:hypothetical protein LCGC14_1360680 [marine sediment metagenome]|uniref:Putative regulatory protein FmdB zinc ribbon domain-containing protein n=1 Tax=marine sediment metagenome TaxID=412755 RepID=A0A0F9MNM3_9ZZZZ